MSKKPLPYMERRVPKNEKYKHVEGKLDTGLTVEKVRVVTAREFSRRRDEIFFRLTPSQLFELYCEYEADEEETLYDSHGSYSAAEGPRIVTHSEIASPVYSKPYLILDMREEAAYAECHLLQARSYPTAMLRRDYMFPDIYNFRNKPNCLIVLYCDDERVSSDAAKVLVNRGIDNIYLLSGGMREFYHLFPTYVEGNVPASFEDMRKSGSRLTESKLRAATGQAPNSARSSISSARVGTVSTTRSAAGGGTSRPSDTRSMSAMSNVSTASVAESIISRASARKGKF